MASQHREGPPNDCTSCRAVWSARMALASENPATRATNAAVGERAKLGERAVRLHTSHLIEWKFLATNATPMPGVTLDTVSASTDVMPLQWAAGVIVACRTCRCILCELARVTRGGWRGQISMADLADRITAGGVKVSEWTVRAHLRTGHNIKKIGHSLVGGRLVDGRLVGGDLVAFEPDSEVTGWDARGRKRFERRPDRFILDPVTQAPTEGPWGDDAWTDGLAERLRNETVWFDPTHPEALWVVRLVAHLIRVDGWPEERLLRKLRERPHRMPLKLPYRYATARLPKKGTPFLRPAPEPPADARPHCANPRCRVVMRAHTRDGLCVECREDAADGLLILAPAQRVSADTYGLAGPAASPLAS